MINGILENLLLFMSATSANSDQEEALDHLGGGRVGIHLQHKGGGLSEGHVGAVQLPDSVFTSNSHFKRFFRKSSLNSQDGPHWFWMQTSGC